MTFSVSTEKPFLQAWHGNGLFVCSKQRPVVQNVANCLHTCNIQSKLPAGQNCLYSTQISLQAYFCRKDIKNELQGPFSMKKLFEKSKKGESWNFSIKTACRINFLKTDWTNCVHVPMNSMCLAMTYVNINSKVSSNLKLWCLFVCFLLWSSIQWWAEKFFKELLGFWAEKFVEEFLC